jgi:hypothetical protein
MIPISPSRFREAAMSALLILLLAASGCAREDIRAYTAPKESPKAIPSLSESSAGADAPMGQSGPTWTLPAGWEELPGSGMRYATIRMGEGEDAPEIRVTPLGAMAGEPLANVNRWLSQLGQPPIGPAQLGDFMRTIEVGDAMADRVRLVGTDAGDETMEILAAIVPHGDRVWFFMAMDTQARLAPRADKFDDFLGSIRMHGDHPAHPPTGPAATPPMASGGPMTGGGMPGMPPAGSGAAGQPATTTAAGNGFGWTLPEGWVEMENTSSMRLATFRAGPESDPAEVTITRFPGDVGGVLANINRWRRQLELAPVSSPDQQPGRPVDVAGSPSISYDLSGPSSRMLVTSTPRGGQTWFVKMTGGEDRLGQEKAHFDAFIASLQLPGAP